MGWGNLAGIIGSELFRAEFAPRYLPAIYACLEIIAVTILGYASYRIALLILGDVTILKTGLGRKFKKKKAEESNDTRRGDKKFAFVYGL
jgi:hypothetical protein